MSFLFSEITKGINYLEVFPVWMVFPAIVHALTALVIATVVHFFKYPKTMAGKLTSVVILALFFANYDPRLMNMANIFDALLPLLPDPSTGSYLMVISLLFITILVGVSILVGKLVDISITNRPTIEPRKIVLGILIVVGFIFSGQLLQTAPIMMTVAKEANVQPAALIDEEITQPQEKPDVYYLVFDRYTNDQVLKQQLDFDNSQFTNKLTKQGFVVKEDAYSNYPYTAMSISSTLNANYTNEYSSQYKDEEVQSRTLFHKLIQQSSVVKGFKDAGYTYHNIGSVYGATSKAPLADVDHMYDTEIEVFGQKKRLRDIEQTTFKQSIFFRFGMLSDISWWPFRVSQLEQPQYTINQLSVLNNLAEQEPGGRFIFAHFISPHPPYLFNADGSFATEVGDNSNGKLVNQKYLDQVQFINSEIDKLVQTIQEQSKGQAVVVINSDEGPYPSAMNLSATDSSADARFDAFVRHTSTQTWSDDWIKMKYGIQQAVHIPKATVNDMAHLSSVNVFRIVMNRYLGYDLDYLPQCHLGMEKGIVKQYSQIDITARLQGETSDYCQGLTE